MARQLPEVVSTFQILRVEAMTERSFNRLMAVFTVVIILFLFAASYLRA